jgi:hypothetical protein
MAGGPAAPLADYRKSAIAIFARDHEPGQFDYFVDLLSEGEGRAALSVHEFRPVDEASGRRPLRDRRRQRSRIRHASNPGPTRERAAHAAVSPTRVGQDLRVVAEHTLPGGRRLRRVSPLTLVSRIRTYLWSFAVPGPPVGRGVRGGQVRWPGVVMTTICSGSTIRGIRRARAGGGGWSPLAGLRNRSRRR